MKQFENKSVIGEEKHQELISPNEDIIEKMNLNQKIPVISKEYVFQSISRL